MAEGLYVYGVIGTGETRNFGPIGIGGRGDPVTNIVFGNLSAVVSSVSMDRYVVGRETMLAHQRVVEKVMADHTVLPVRYYSVAPNAEDIRSLLRTRHAEFEKALRELDNTVELGLKALWKDMDKTLARILGGLGAGPGRSGGHEPGEDRGSEAGIGPQARAALDRENAEQREVLLLPLRTVSKDLRLQRTYGDDMIMNGTFLVDRALEREFDGRVQQLEGSHGDEIEFRYIGPAPPYGFVNLRIREQSA